MNYTHLHTSYINKSTFCILQPRQEKPKKDRIDHYRPQGEEFDKAYTYDYKSRTDDTEVSPQRVATEKITVDRGDITRMEATEKPRYPKDIDVGRIVIEEIPEEREEIPKHKILRKEHGGPRSTGVTIAQHEVEEHPKTYVTEDVIKVGKLDVIHLEKEMVEAKTVQDKIRTYKDRVDGPRKVSLVVFCVFHSNNTFSLTIIDLKKMGDTKR